MDKIISIEDYRELPDYPELVESPDTHGLKNGVEDQMLQLIDRKKTLTDLADGNGSKLAKELMFVLAILSDSVRQELLSLVENPKQGDLSFGRLESVMLDCGFNWARVESVMEMFGRKKSIKIFKKNSIIKEKEKMMGTKNNNNWTKDFSMEEILKAAEALGFEAPKGQSKAKVAEAVWDHINGIPEEEEIAEVAANFYNLAEWIKSGKAKNRAEAEKLEAEAAKENGKPEENPEVEEATIDGAEVKEEKALEDTKIKAAEAKIKAKEIKNVKIEKTNSSLAMGRRAFMSKLISSGKFTRGEIVDKVLEKDFGTTKSSIQTELSDGRNPKYNRFESLVLIDGEGKVSFAK